MDKCAQIAVVIGASGAIGSAMVSLLRACDEFDAVVALSRNSLPKLDLDDEASIEAAATHCQAQGEVRFVFNATGFLHGENLLPEKNLKQLSASSLFKNFTVNAIAPALIMKHFLPLMPKQGRCVFATLTAKVGSIEDNRLGGWHAYRAAKAAHNQLVKTVSIEMARSHQQLVCLALHPGTVESGLSAPFAKTGLNIRSADEAAHDLWRVIEATTPDQSGGFFSYNGEVIPW